MYRQPRLDKAQWHEACAYFNHRCAVCNFNGRLEADHWIPVSRGGVTSRANIVPLCQRCNRSKKDTYPDLWLRNVHPGQAFDALERVERYLAQYVTSPV